MKPALPGEPGPDEPSNYDVGWFEQGSAISRWALARYLVGRAIGESVSRGLLILALGVLVLAGILEWLGSTFWSIVTALLALAFLALRSVLRVVLQRLSAVGQVGPVQTRLQAIVADTRSDVQRELRRIGLPGRPWTLPMLPLGLLGRERRRRTVERLRAFDLDRVVPKSRVEELHLILRNTAGR